MQESFNRLLEQYRFLAEQIEKQNALIHELSEKELYRNRVEILKSVPGIGTIAAMELLLELQDVARFRQADQLAAYVGLPPSQYSSADKIRMGRITKAGKHSVRATLVQVAWQLIRKDQTMREKYERIKTRSGASCNRGNCTNTSFASETDLVGFCSVSIGFVCLKLESTSDVLGDGVVYICVRLIGDHVGELATPPKRPRIDYLRFQQERKPRIGDWFGFQALEDSIGFNAENINQVTR